MDLMEAFNAYYSACVEVGRDTTGMALVRSNGGWALHRAGRDPIPLGDTETAQVILTRSAWVIRNAHIQEEE